MIKNRIKELRKLRKLSQARLAEMVGTCQPYIHVLENNEIRHITVAWIDRIAKALDVTTMELMGNSAC